MLFISVAEDFQLGTTKNKPNKLIERDSNPGPPDCESDSLLWLLALPNRSRCRYGIFHDCCFEREWS